MAPPSLHGVVVGPLPPLPRYYEALRRPADPLAALRCLRLAIPPCRPDVRSLAQAADPLRGPGDFGLCSPGHVFTTETTGPPRFLANPLTTCPALRPRQDPSDAAFTVRGCGLPLVTMSVGSCINKYFGVQSHGLPPPCVRFAVWIAPRPRNTRFRLVASLGRVEAVPPPQGSTERFRDATASLLLSQASPGARWRTFEPHRFKGVF